MTILRGISRSSSNTRTLRTATGLGLVLPAPTRYVFGTFMFSIAIFIQNAFFSNNTFSLTRHELKKNIPHNSPLFRWNSIYTCYERVVQSFEQIMIITPDREAARAINTTENKLYLQQIVNLLSHFHRATKLLEGDSVPTLSMVIPCILSIILELEEPEVCSKLFFHTKSFNFRIPMPFLNSPIYRKNWPPN